jgi:asparagine synthetase B (glutamine-hydrolysing)
MEIPVDFKIKRENDELRKLIWREVALEIGTPKSAALRAKKAFQYSSGVHKAIRKLARMKGYTKKNAKTAGFKSLMEAYLKNLELGIQ